MMSYSTKVRVVDDIFTSMRENKLTYGEAKDIIDFMDYTLTMIHTNREWAEITDPETGETSYKKVKDITNDPMDYDIKNERRSSKQE